MKRIASYLAAVNLLKRERAAAGQTVERLLRETPREEWPSLATQADLQTCGALELLGRLAIDEVTRDPKRALGLAELACAVAEALPEHPYPAVVVAQLRAHAFKDLGDSLRVLGRHEEAMRALTRGETWLDDFGVLAHDRAIVRFSMAVTLQEMNRLPQSMSVLAECKDIFREHDDRRRLMLCGLAQGVVLQRVQKFREAREAYLLLLAAEPEMNREDSAALHKVIGLCSIELRDFAVAESSLTRAVALYRQLGQPIEILKAETSLGRLYIRRGDIETGITHLRPVRRAFLQKSMAEEAGICALEIIEGMLARGNAPEADRLARMVIREFTSAGLSGRAITALGYLSEAIAASEATVALVGNVREYILSLQVSPEREFQHGQSN